MANYRPYTVNVDASLTNSGLAATQDISTDEWGLFLLKGTALGPAGTAMGSGAIQVWEDSAPTTGPATHTTFTDAEGRYGVTCTAGVALNVKFLGV